MTKLASDVMQQMCQIWCFYVQNLKRFGPWVKFVKVGSALPEA